MMTAHNRERARILRMLEEGKVSADEAARLLDALDAQAARPAASAQRIRITVRETGRSPVHVTLPRGLVRTLVGLAALASLPNRGFAEEIVRLVEEGTVGKLLEVEHAGQHIEIIAE